MIPTKPSGPVNRRTVHLTTCNNICLLRNAGTSFNVNVQMDSNYVHLQSSSVGALFDRIAPNAGIGVVGAPVGISTRPGNTHLIRMRRPLSRGVSSSPRLLPVALGDTVRSFGSTTRASTRIVRRIVSIHSKVPISIHHRRIDPRALWVLSGGGPHSATYHKRGVDDDERW